MLHHVKSGPSSRAPHTDFLPCRYGVVVSWLTDPDEEWSTDEPSARSVPATVPRSPPSPALRGHRRRTSTSAPTPLRSPPSAPAPPQSPMFPDYRGEWGGGESTRRSSTRISSSRHRTPPARRISTTTGRASQPDEAPGHRADRLAGGQYRRTGVPAVGSRAALHHRHGPLGLRTAIGLRRRHHRLLVVAAGRLGAAGHRRSDQLRRARLRTGAGVPDQDALLVDAPGALDHGPGRTYRRIASYTITFNTAAKAAELQPAGHLRRHRQRRRPAA